MKFTDGYWLMRPGCTARYATDIADVRADAHRMTLYAPVKHVTRRGGTLLPGTEEAAGKVHRDGSLLELTSGELTLRVNPRGRGDWSSPRTTGCSPPRVSGGPVSSPTPRDATTWSDNSPAAWGVGVRLG
jgi:hypothetical protein